MKSDNKIIIVEPSPIVSTGLAQFFEDAKQLSVVSQLDNTERLSEKLAAFNPEVLIINPVFMAYDHDGMVEKTLREYPDTIVLGLVTSYIDKNVLKQFNDVIEMSDSKQKVVSKVFNLLSNNCVQQEKTESVELSNREIDVLVALAKGMTNKEISDQLFISVHTVITHRKNIIRKTGIKSVSGLTVYALLNNLVDESEIYK